MTNIIRIMSFNIWVDGIRGGQPVNQTAEVIRQARADVVGMQEVFNNTQKIADYLGWNYLHHGRDTAVLSRYPILEGTPEGTGARLKMDDGQEFYLCNVHLAHAPYQPYQLLGIPYADAPFIATEAEAIAAARAAREQEVAQVLRDITNVEDVPVFVTGDFNEPSHWDWSEAAARAGRHPLKVSYPTSQMLEEVGFIDTYRQLYPDEMEKPGYTWPTVAAAQETDKSDRIDFILYRGPQVTAQSMQIVGGDRRYADLLVAPYPSDHRAILATFSLDMQAGETG
jgi:exodeoxyribonuclease-3